MSLSVFVANYFLVHEIIRNCSNPITRSSRGTKRDRSNCVGTQTQQERRDFILMSHHQPTKVFNNKTDQKSHQAGRTCVQGLEAETNKQNTIKITKDSFD